MAVHRHTATGHLSPKQCRATFMLLAHTCTCTRSLKSLCLWGDGHTHTTAEWPTASRGTRGENVRPEAHTSWKNRDEGRGETRMRRPQTDGGAPPHAQPDPNGRGSSQCLLPSAPPAPRHHSPAPGRSAQDPPALHHFTVLARLSASGSAGAGRTPPSGEPLSQAPLHSQPHGPGSHLALSSPAISHQTPRSQGFHAPSVIKRDYWPSLTLTQTVHSSSRA